ncbi:MAG: hypothetical protein WBB45_09410 [Cyclobacteriaceae bacterium]
MKKTKLSLDELQVSSFATTDKIMVRGGDDNPSCIPETCTQCPADMGFA